VTTPSAPDGDAEQTPAAPPPPPPPPPPPLPPGYAAAGPPGYGYPYPYPLPGAPYGIDRFGRPYSDKSKIIAGVLQIVLGVFGAGRWYTGHYGIAVAQLLTCGGLGVWSLIDGIVMLAGDVTDPEGRPLHG
jgi:hypothetical protein